jgi:hypothetical protein
MSNTTKKRQYNKKNELLTINVSMNSLLKNPIKGGTPAIENSKIVNVSKWKLLKWKLLKECRVLNLVKIVVNSVQNSNTSEVLYRNIYANIRMLLSQVK